MCSGHDVSSFDVFGEQPVLNIPSVIFKKSYSKMSPASQRHNRTEDGKHLIDLYGGQDVV